MALSLVQYDPNDYKLATVLTSGAGEILDTEEKIGPVFSLYFQWKEQSPCYVRFQKVSGMLTTCSIDRDVEERSISQLYVSLPLASLESTAFGENLFIRMVVFEVCFEFEAPIIEKWVENENQNFVIEVPSSIKMVKARKSPRSSETGVIVEAQWKSDKIIDVQINEMGLDSCLINTILESGKQGTLTIHGHSFQATCARSNVEEKKSYIKINFSNDYESGLYFDSYKKFRYPKLEARKNFDTKTVLELYSRSGFFANFSSSFDEEDKFKKVNRDWEAIKSAEHKLTADYCLIENKMLIGASSLAHFLQNKEVEYWVFHQLCSDKNLSSLDDTGTLYNWRSEYLWLRKSEVLAFVWFRSQSRWLERIYVKFHMQNPGMGELRPCHLYSYTHCKNDHDENGVECIDFGNSKRAIYQNNQILASAGPDYVHINGNMNIIISEDGDWTKVIMAANKICSALKQSEIYFRVELFIDSPFPEGLKIEPQAGTDRLTKIKKQGMLDLMACTKHSIAVTKLKKGIA